MRSSSKRFLLLRLRSASQPKSILCLRNPPVNLALLVPLLLYAQCLSYEFVNAIFTAQFQIDINHSFPLKPIPLSTCVCVSSLASGELSLDLCWLSPDNENILCSIKQSGMFPGSVPRVPQAVVAFAVTKLLQHPAQCK